MTARNDLIALRDDVVAGTAKRSDFRCLEVPMQDMRYTLMPSAAWLAYKCSVDAAIELLKLILPGWGWRIGSCHLSDDAFVFPDYNCPIHGARLHDTVPTLVDGVEWAQFTDVDLRPAGKPARALLIATLNAMIESADT